METPARSEPSVCRACNTVGASYSVPYDGHRFCNAVCQQANWVARVSSAAAATAAAERTEGAGGHEEPDEDVDEDEDEGIYAEHDTRRGRSSALPGDCPRGCSRGCLACLGKLTPRQQIVLYFKLQDRVDEEYARLMAPPKVGEHVVLVRGDARIDCVITKIRNDTAESKPGMLRVSWTKSVVGPGGAAETGPERKPVVVVDAKRREGGAHIGSGPGAGDDKGGGAGGGGRTSTSGPAGASGGGTGRAAAAAAAADTVGPEKDTMNADVYPTELRRRERRLTGEGARRICEAVGIVTGGTTELTWQAKRLMTLVKRFLSSELSKRQLRRNTPPVEGSAAERSLVLAAWPAAPAPLKAAELALASRFLVALMFKLSSAASLDDDSAAEKDAHCPLLLPCTLSSVHPPFRDHASFAWVGSLVPRPSTSRSNHTSEPARHSTVVEPSTDTTDNLRSFSLAAEDRGLRARPPSMVDAAPPAPAAGCW